MQFYVSAIDDTFLLRLLLLVKLDSRFFSFLCVCAALNGALSAKADELDVDAPQRSPTDAPVLATSGGSGGMNVPDGRTLPEGVAVFGFNNLRDPQFAKYARGDNYQFGIGLFRYLELSGRLANFPVNKEGDIGVRDLSANLKISMPKMFRNQPDIAIGLNDLGGGAANFQSKYIVASDTFGLLRVMAGTANGKPYLSRFFGSVALALGNTGVSTWVERNNAAWHAGLRYGSEPISYLGNAQIVATAQRSFGAHAPDGSKFTRPVLGIHLAIPFGDASSRSRHAAFEPGPIWTPRGSDGPDQLRLTPAVTTVASTWVPTVKDTMEARPVSIPGVQKTGLQWQSMRKMRAELVKAGLERVRVGRDGDTLILEYENHRYNQNEVDAIGIVLGVGTMLAPDGVKRVAAVAKKADLALYMTSVDQLAYRRFVGGSEAETMRSLLTFQYRPTYSSALEWFDEVEGPRGYSRIRIDPSLSKFVGTEVGVLDYSLAADIQGFVPLWKGAELTTSYMVNLAESSNVAQGVFQYAQQPSGVKAAVLSQSFWLTDRILNVSTVGKFRYHDTGVQNETLFFVPGRDDQVHLQYTHLRHPEKVGTSVVNAGSVSYLWNYQPLNMSVEAGYNRFVGGDYGPSIQINRWFGNVQAQMFMRRNNLETKIGFGLAFPLTPRQGMRPGLTHLEGSGSFPLQLQTKLAKSGQCNCITKGIVEEMPMVYSGKSIFFNQGKIGKDYLLSQLQRMRDAALMYAPLSQ